MRKKFTMLLAALLLGLGATNAQVTKYYKPGERKATFTVGDKVMFYNTALVLNNDRTEISQDRTGFLIGTTSFALDKQKPQNAPIFSEKVGVFTVETVEDQSTYYKVNVKGANGYVGIGGVVNNANASTLCFHKWTTVADNKKTGDDVASENATGEGFVKKSDITASDNLWIVANDEMGTLWNGNQASFTTWSTGHPYAIYSVVEATTADLEELLAQAKTTAKETFANLSLYEVGTANNDIDAVALEDDDLETALNHIDAIVLNVKKTIDGKNVKFCNKSTGDPRGGKYLGYDNAYSRPAAIADGGDAVIWTIKLNADGNTFKLYNFVNDLYLGTPADPTPTVKDEASAPSFKFIITGDNEVALATGDKMVHIANHSNYKAINYWSTTDKASLWGVTSVPAIVVDHETLNSANAAKAALPYAIQEAYGLVTDATNYYSNWKSTQEGSYEALLDNDHSDKSYFHSAYTDEAKAESAPAHYIQADMGDGKSIDEFYFYMVPRAGNGNNRPKNITVSGSNDIDGDFTKIADVTTTLDGTMTPYVSAKLGTNGTNYRYIRLTVTSTNSSTKFFTLSELYFFPANSDINSLVDSYNAFSQTSITSNDFATAATALINAETVLALSNIKKEINTLLTANEGNHAASPALGQYPTATYEALEAAFNDDAVTQETLEAAVAEFEKSLNKPVYFITSKHDGYAAGSAIYYDGAWKWKKANIYDRQMWMTIPGYTEENVPAVNAYDANGISYAICDYLTGTKMRGKDVQIVKVADWEGAYNLQYNADATSTDAAQHAKDNGQLVNWKPGTTTDAKASVWGVEYIGNTYDLDKLTDEHINALAAMQTAYSAKVRYADVVIGDGIGQYQGNKDALVAALDAAEVITGKSLVELATMSVDDIVAAKDAINNAEALVINQPKAGFYRIKSMNANDANKKGKSLRVSDGKLALDVTEDAASIMYIDAANGILNYGSGLYINTYKAPAEVGAQAVGWNFIENAGVAGTYALKYNDNTGGQMGYYLSDWTGNVTYGQNDANAAWIFEEVTELPVSVSSAGSATFIAPVALEIPEGVKAYTGVVTGDYLILRKVEGIIPANTGVVLEAAEATYNFNIVADVEAIASDLVGSTAAVLSTSVTEGKVPFTLQKPGDAVVFMQFDGDVLAGSKAYLELDQTGAGAISIRFEGSTDIENVEIRNQKSEMIFDLLGRRVEAMTKGGIYIVNGKKVVIR